VLKGGHPRRGFGGEGKGRGERLANTLRGQVPYECLNLEGGGQNEYPDLETVGDLLEHCTLGLSTNETGDNFAILEEQEGRNAHY